MILFYMIFFVVFINKSEARDVNDLICQSYPDGYCLLEDKEIEEELNLPLWMFDWDHKTCVRIYWRYHCGPPDKGNIFTSERRCFNDCAGLS